VDTGMSAAASDAMYAGTKKVVADKKPDSADKTAETAQRTGVALNSTGSNRTGATAVAAGGNKAPVRQNKSVAAAVKPKQLTREEMIAQIPGSSVKAPVGGERVSGNEFTRNVSNTLNAPVPGALPIRMGAKAVKGATSSSREVANLAETPVTFLGRSGARPVRGPERVGGPASQSRLGEGQRSISLKDQGRLALERRRQSDALEDSGLKKGGAVKTKKMASGGMTSNFQRADGIASKGKTKCKIY
jgi:hypothetical protein